MRVRRLAKGGTVWVAIVSREHIEQINSATYDYWSAICTVQRGDPRSPLFQVWNHDPDGSWMTNLVGVRDLSYQATTRDVAQASRKHSLGSARAILKVWSWSTGVSKPMSTKSRAYSIQSVINTKQICAPTVNSQNIPYILRPFPKRPWYHDSSKTTILGFSRME